MFLCIVQSVQSTQHVKCSACFLRLFCCPWWNVRLWTNVNWKRHINKGKVIGSTLKIFHFVGCEMPSSQHLDIIRVETLHKNVVHNIALSAGVHARHLAHVFRKLRWTTIHTTLKIRLLCLESILLHLSLLKGWQLWVWWTWQPVTDSVYGMMNMAPVTDKVYGMMNMATCNWQSVWCDEHGNLWLTRCMVWWTWQLVTDSAYGTMNMATCNWQCVVWWTWQPVTDKVYGLMNMTTCNWQYVWYNGHGNL